MYPLFLRRCFWVTSVCGFATWLAASPQLPLTHLVDEQTLVAVTVSDAPALLRGWDASPLALTWDDPQVVKFLAPLRDQLQVDTWDADSRAATGLSVRELFGLVEGEVLFALPPFTLSQVNAKTPPAFLLALEVGSQAAKLQALLATASEQHALKVETEIFADVEVHVLPLAGAQAGAQAAGGAAKAGPSLAWALVDGVWLLSPSKERVFMAIDALHQGGVAAPLGSSERFVRTRQKAAGAQVLAYANLPAIYPLLEEAVAAAKAQAQANPIGLDFMQVFKALGLDVFGEAYAACWLEPKQARLDGGMTYTEERGVVRLLAYQPGPTAQPAWVSAKWPVVSSVRFSVPKAYEGLEALVNTINPLLFGMAQGQIHAFDKKLGVDLRRDLIGSLGDDVVTAYALPLGADAATVPSWTELDQLVAVSLKNPEAFGRALNALKNLAGPAADQLFTTRDYLGTALFTLNQPGAQANGQPGRGVSYAIAHDTLLVGIGSPAMVESALQGMDAGAGGFWQRADVKAALADTPPDAVSLQVQDMRVLLAALAQSAVTYEESLAGENPAAAKPPTYVDVSATPDAEVWARYWGLAAGSITRTPEGLFSSTRLVYPQP